MRAREPETAIPSARQLAAAVWARSLAGATVAVGAVVLLGGWIGGVEVLVRLRPEYAAMVPTTALSFLVAAGAVLWRRRSVLRAAAAIVGTVAALDLLLILSGSWGGIDAFLLPPKVDPAARSMAPATALCFLLVSISLFGLSSDRRAAATFVPCATAGLLLSLTAVVGYAFDSQALYAVSIFTAMALHTALSFVALFAAMLLRRPDFGWVGILLGDRAGSAGARRLFPIVLAGPLVLCFVALYLTEAGLFDANFRLSVLAILTMALLAASVLHNATIENAAERRLMETMEELREALAHRNLLLGEVHHRVRNNLQLIVSLISIESARIGNPDCRRGFDAVASRIHTMSAVHEQLVSSRRPLHVSAADFLRKVCTLAPTRTGEVRHHVDVEVEADDEPIEIQTATTLGLLVNELVLSAVGHEGGKARTVSVRYHTTAGGGAKLVIAARNLDPEGAEADILPEGETATRIIAGLAQQLDGKLTAETGARPAVTIDFPPRRIDAAGSG